MNQIDYSPTYGKVYAECSHCEKTFIVDSFVPYHFCNYCKGTLVKGVA